MDRLVGRLEASEHTVLAQASLASAAVMRHFLADPLLPTELLHSQWPGEALRADYDRFESALRRLLRAWIREQRREAS
jgi:phenylacetic acid degradation operon negative regulatory protein